MSKAVTIHKFEDNVLNEDAVIARENLIAVSDGAGGGGVYAECWSSYLVEHLPDSPIRTFEELDEWIGSIWEPFYNESEEKAKLIGGMLLDKFYDEGSFATLVAIWRVSANECVWMSYGDSVAFHYNRRTKKLEHSFTELKDFSNPPYLINCKDELNREGFKTGVFHTDEDSVIFVASDTLSHYIITMYEVENKIEYEKELHSAMEAQTKNSLLIKNALSINKLSFEEKVLGKLSHCFNPQNLSRHLHSKEKKGMLGHDDYSFAMM